jgi:hypothetical protein
MTIKELKSLIKEILMEAVPFDKAADIRQGLKTKHGKYDELEDYTFGVEFEFKPVTEELSNDQIEDKLSNLYGSSDDYGLSDAYDEWLDQQREYLVGRWAKYSDGTPESVDDFDLSYGPISDDDYQEHISEPQEVNYKTEEEYNDAYDKWSDKLNDVGYEYKRWDRNERHSYIDEYIRLLVRSGSWRDLIPEDEQGTVDIESGISNAIDLIETLGEPVRKDDKSDSTTWAVGEDGPNVEIRSRHMKQTADDFRLISTVGNWVSDQSTSGTTGMHVHIGLPRDFDMFDLLAMTTLVDEKAVKQLTSIDRDFASYAKLRKSISNLILSRVREYILNQSNDKLVPKSFTLTNAQMKEVLSNFDRNHGTNIASFSEHKTIEFRYLESGMAYNVLKWIEYFLLLPRIAKSRNKVTLDSIYGETLVATRMPDKIKFTYFVSRTLEPKREKVPMPTEPADVIKSKAYEFPSKLDVAKQQLSAEKQKDTQ